MTEWRGGRKGNEEASFKQATYLQKVALSQLSSCDTIIPHSVDSIKDSANNLYSRRGGSREEAPGEGGGGGHRGNDRNEGEGGEGGKRKDRGRERDVMLMAMHCIELTLDGTTQGEELVVIG